MLRKLHTGINLLDSKQFHFTDILRNLLFIRGIHKRRDELVLNIGRMLVFWFAPGFSDLFQNLAAVERRKMCLLNSAFPSDDRVHEIWNDQSRLFAVDKHCIDPDRCDRSECVRTVDQSSTSEWWEGSVGGNHTTNDSHGCLWILLLYESARTLIVFPFSKDVMDVWGISIYTFSLASCDWISVDSASVVVPECSSIGTCWRWRFGLGPETCSIEASLPPAMMIMIIWYPEDSDRL